MVEVLQQFQTLFSNMGQGAFLQNADGQLVDVNSAALALFGLTREEFFERTSSPPAWQVITEDGQQLPPECHPATLALTTGKTVRDMVAGVFSSKRNDFIWLEVNAIPMFHEEETVPYQVLVTLHDISERKQVELVYRARLHLMQFAADHTLDELLVETLDRLEALTGSLIGFYHSYDEESRCVTLKAWSTRTVRDCCRADEKNWYYSVDKAGVWIDCITARKPVIHNEYASLDHCNLSKEPAVVVREMVVPVFRNNKIVAILGLGNKPHEYNESDVKVVSLLADLAWDIAEKKLQEEQQLQSARQYEVLTETSLDAYWIVDRTGKIIEVNDLACRQYGYSREEMLNLSLRDLEARENDAQLEGHSANIVVQRHDRFETCHRRKDGTLLDVEVSATFIPSKDIFLAFIRDITTRKKEERALQESEERFRQLIETTNTGYVILDELGRVVDANSEYVRLTGRNNLQEIIGHCVTEWTATHDLDRNVDEIRKCIETGVVRGFVVDYLSPEGVLTTLEINASVTRKLDSLQILTLCRDITERKRIEESMKASEAFLLKTQRTAHIGIYDFDIVQDRWTSSNEMDDIFGIDAAFTRTFSGWLDLIHPDQRDRMAAYFSDLLVAQRWFEMEYEIIRPVDGQIRWVFGIGEFEYDTDGKAKRMFGTIQDITDRKQAEEALRDQQQMINAIVESSQDWIWAIDLSGNHTYSNQAVQQILNYSPEEFQCMGLELVHHEDRQKINELWSGWIASRQGWSNIVVRWRAKDGFYRYLESTAVPILDPQGELLGFRGVDRDITERKLAEEALRASEERFRSIMALSPDIISIIGQGGELLYNSPAAQRIHGYTDEEMIGINTFDLIHPDDQEKVSKGFNLLLQSPNQVHVVQYRYRNKDSSYSWMECSANNQLTNPLLRGIVAISRNIDDRIRMEDERLRLEQQLLHTQKLESLGILAGGIAHDFNNILTAIIGNVELAIISLNPQSPALDNLQRIEKSAVRAAELARQMLAYSGKGKFVIEAIDLNQLVEEMGHIFEVSISKKALLRYDLNRPLPRVDADATQISQIVMNLVINASESFGDKSGIIAIRTGCVECTENYLKDAWLVDPLRGGLYVYLEVADTGCGMDQETLAKIFDPFFTTKFTGRGLGMAAVLGIVRGHHGAIKVTSELGNGSTFKVLLPASDQELEIEPLQTQTEDWKGQGKVLLVDDEEDVRDIGMAMLQMLGFTVVTANDGNDAVEVFKANPDISFIVLDLTMPIMDGEQCFYELMRIKPDAKVVMSSGFSEQEVTQKFMGKKLSGFIQKPYTMSAMKEAIQKIPI
ncbi:PAS domain S-box protein [Geobacter pelophilus]|uniref:histidine kinase n=1 Tax=Geoanaerobacter pelophilus TaxID=60036 RepID=A0AAW4LAP0_9BACT|nr:PAS domain S-box protein [Geoanaerobacter pelophilus]MBT0666597.1 PAS domain S-box protein [Geoanaerobacter pelophilus]